MIDRLERCASCRWVCATGWENWAGSIRTPCTLQTIHERPILGGFVARIPASIGARYNAMPVIGSLLRLSSGTPLSAERPDEDRPQAAAILASLGVRYVVVNASSCSPDLLAYVRRDLPLRLVSESDGRALYAVDPASFVGPIVSASGSLFRRWGRWLPSTDGRHRTTCSCACCGCSRAGWKV